MSNHKKENAMAKVKENSRMNNKHIKNEIEKKAQKSEEHTSANENNDRHHSVPTLPLCTKLRMQPLNFLSVMPGG